MQILIKSRHMNVAPQLRQHIERKVQRLARLVDSNARLEVIVTEEQTRSASDRFSVHLAVTGNGHPVHSEISALNVSTALDLVLDKVEGQLGRLKDRLTKGRRHHRVPIKTLAISSSLEPEEAEGISQEQVLEAEEESRLTQISIEDGQHEELWERIQEIRSMPARAMTDKEVIEQMEKDGAAFYPFFNEETSSVNVMYRLDQGGYGLLVPAP